MFRLSNSAKGLAFVGVVTFGAIPASAFPAASMKMADGQAYWSGNPGPVDPGAYWTSGQRYADPHDYMDWYGMDSQDYKMTVHAPHAGANRCVWRERVLITDWEFDHPYLRVCR